LCDTVGGVVLRVHFTAEDCSRVQVAESADPLWEMVFSRRRLNEAASGSVFQPWTRWIRRDVESGTIRPGLRGQADRAYRARTLLDGGVHGLLSSLRPLMQWRPPVLEVQYPVHRDLHLDGRGLRLGPSYFCRSLPVALADPDLPPTLVYPVHHDDGWRHQPAGSALTALLGATRYAVLAAIGHGASTTELAGRLGVAPSSVSRHTSALRQAGILTTHRHGPSVLHTITPVGAALLRRGTAD
jgi:DNA-binding transcriptional ArsR family regulator